MSTFKTTLFRAFDNSDETVMSFRAGSAYQVESWRYAEDEDGHEIENGREFVLCGGDELIVAQDQELEVYVDGHARFLDTEGNEQDVWFEVVQRRPLAPEDIRGAL